MFKRNTLQAMVKFIYSLFGLFLLIGQSFGQIQNPRNLKYPWATDTVKHKLTISDLHMAAEKDHLKPLNYPAFIKADQKAFAYYPHEPVISVVINGEARAYPLSVLTLFELCNDTVGGEPIMVTFCPMCNAAMVFNRKVESEGETQILEFGISGILLHNDMIMYDTKTESWWQQLMGEAIAGKHTGAELKMMRAMVISVKDYLDRYPDGKILHPGIVPAELSDHRPFYHLDHDPQHLTSEFHIPESVDHRLPPLERVIDIHTDDHTKIYPYTEISKQQVINEEFDGLPFVIFYHSETVSVMDEDDLKSSRKTGSATAFRSDVDGKRLTFYKDGMYFRDQQTKSQWDITGYCREGALKGKQLWLLPHSNHFAFAYLAFFPESEIYRAP